MPKAKARTATAKICGVVGSDEAEVKRTGAQLAEELRPQDAGDFGLEVIDGAVDNADQAAIKIRSTIEALQTIPFFGGAKLVWLKNANFLADNVLGRSAAVQDALEELAGALNQDLGEGTAFLLTAIEVDKRRSFYKSFAKKAEVQIFDGIDSTRSGWEEEATEIVRKHAEGKGLQFEDDALVLFVLLTGGDRRQIENELEKIDIFLGKKRSIAIGQVRDLVPLSRSGVIFELGNALAERDLQRALELVRRLLDQGESAIGILLVAILPTIRNLLLAGDLMSRYRMSRPHAPFQFISAVNRLPAEAVAHLPRKKDGAISGYALGIAAQNSHGFDRNRLLEGMDACLDANVRLVSTQLDHELVLTEIVIKLIG
jgi:DNA polymerase-3 subunit delta